MGYQWRYFLLILCFSSGVSFFSQAQDSINIGVKKTLYSQILKENRNVWIHLPPRFTTANTYPVVYLLDAEINFSCFTGVSSFLSYGSRKKIPEMIVVGIVNTNRTRDLTPTQSFVVNPADTLEKMFEKSGGSEAFLQFLHNELQPFIHAMYSHVSEEIFIGHSFGGLTVIDCLLNHPDYFDAYVANDPSLWWDDGYEVKQAGKKWLENKTGWQGKKLFVSHSGGASSPNHFGANGAAMNLSFSHLLQQNKAGLISQEKTYTNETHGTISLPANIDALNFLYAEKQKVN